MSKLLGLIEKLVPEIQKNQHVHAMWLEGSYATGKFNEKSDIDVWMDVDGGTFNDCSQYFEEQLSKLVEIRLVESCENYSKEPKLSKFTFHLEGFPEEQVVELDLQEHGRNFQFSKSEHTIKVLFDKGGTIKWKN